MDTSGIIKRMCLNELSNVDVKAICKTRGFSLKNASDSRFLENFLISDQGIKEAIGELSKDEVILLYMLSQESEAVDISFF